VTTESFPIRFSLKNKHVLGISCLVGLIIILTSYLSSVREEQMLSDSMDHGGLLLATTLALACQDPIIREAYDELIPYTERIIARGGDIREISIFDQDGRYLAHRKRGESSGKLGEVLDTEGRKRYIEGLDDAKRLFFDDLIEYIAPVKVGSSLLGTVVLKYSIDRLTIAKQASRRQIILIGLVAMLAGVLLSAALSQFITSGIDLLIKGTQLVAAGNLQHRLPVTSQDEIGMLATRFNEMIVNLESNKHLVDRKIFEIETLFKASQAMNFQSDTDKLVRKILSLACEALTAERGSVMLLVDQTDELATRIVYGANLPETPVQSDTRIKSGEGVAGTVLKVGRTMIVNDGHNDPLFKSFETTSPFEQTITNLISVPLKIGERVSGVINVVNKNAESGFNDDDQRLMEALAQQAAMAMEHARLYELAITDGLTKLYIHRYFQARLEEEITRAKRYHSVVSLILFDIDHFKKFNDTYGHQQGDMVLIETARLIRLTIRETIDIPARYGGEEFTIILPETDSQGAHLVSERLRKTVESFDFPGQDTPLKVTISLGIATFPDHAPNRATLIRRSDVALYNCKRSGRNCSTIWNESLADKV
jgi:diguanylate cyclase (GGDEF)-like protein